MREKEREEMAIKPQYDTYRYTGEKCKLTAQSVVECRLPGSEIGNVLVAWAKVECKECSTADGEVRYGGKLLVCVVYEDGEKKICRAERGAEFFHKAEGEEISPACFAKALLSVEKVTYRREGSGLYISVVVGADISVYGAKQLTYFAGGESIVTKKEEIQLCKTVCVSGETEGEDEFDADVFGDILLHDEETLVHRVVASAGQVEIEGEMIVSVCALTSDGELCSYERLIPFKTSIPCEDAFGDVSAWARVAVKSAHVTAGVDEDKNTSKILLTYVLSADCFLSSKESLLLPIDAFCTEAELLVKKEKGAGRYLTNLEKRVERIGGVATLSQDFDGDYTLQCATLPKADIFVNGGEAEGVITAEVILCAGDGSHRRALLSLPFTFPIRIGEEVEASAVVCGLNVKRSKEGVTEAEATLKMSLRSFEKREWEYVCEGETGDAFEDNGSAISLFTLRAGEDLWQVAKRLGRDPDELKKSNPELEFPVKEGERLLVYRQIK